MVVSRARTAAVGDPMRLWVLLPQCMHCCGVWRSPTNDCTLHCDRFKYDITQPAGIQCPIIRYRWPRPRLNGAELPLRQRGWLQRCLLKALKVMPIAADAQGDEGDAYQMHLAASASTARTAHASRASQLRRAASARAETTVTHQDHEQRVHHRQHLRLRKRLHHQQQRKAKRPQRSCWQQQWTAGGNKFAGGDNDVSTSSASGTERERHCAGCWLFLHSHSLREQGALGQRWGEQTGSGGTTKY